jgi:hypothetical protein
MHSRKPIVPFQHIAREAQMTLQSVHRDHIVQKAGQAVAAALLLPRTLPVSDGRVPQTLHLPKGTVSGLPCSAPTNSALAAEGPVHPQSDAGRVAGRETMTTERSTAALSSFRQGLSPSSAAPRGTLAVAAPPQSLEGALDSARFWQQGWVRSSPNPPLLNYAVLYPSRRSAQLGLNSIIRRPS